MINDIIRLKEQVGMTEEDATPENQRAWYEYALKEGLIETEFADGKLVGFVEWLRLEKIPLKWGDEEINHATIKTAPILYIGNVIVTIPNIIWKLKDRILRKNKDRIATYWHRKRDDRIVIIKRRNACLAL